MFYGEWLLTNVLKDFLINNNLKVRDWVFSIPKQLRIYLLYDRKLLAKLSKCAWSVIKAYLKSTVPFNDAVPGASIVVQTYGDFLNHFSSLAQDLKTRAIINWAQP